MRGRSSGGPLLWPLAFTLIGIVLLLHNFLLLGDFNVINLWPLLLVVVGAQILLRGDVTGGGEARRFGITRGSVESGTLEISAGSIDVGVRALNTPERLIAGQYAYQSRPDLSVRDNHAHLVMDRSKTPWLAFNDWEMGIAGQMPWELIISTHLGQVNLDLSNLIIQTVIAASGIGDIRLVCPPEAFAPLTLQSSLGNIHVVTPPGYKSLITVNKGRFFNIHSDSNRYEEVEPRVFMSRDSDADAPLVEVQVSGTFGDAYLA